MAAILRGMSRPGHTRPRLGPVGILAVALVVVALVVSGCGLFDARPSPSSEPPVAAASPPAPSAAPSTSEPPAVPASPEPSQTPRPSLQVVRPIPSPSPGAPVFAVAPLSGRLVPIQRARRLPIAVMVDDHPDARPQSGFRDASVVWHAPAEGGVPRYMLLFGEGDPPSVGPVRSARQYYIAWASEWNALYVHVGGSPQALRTLRERGRGQLVWNADEFRWGGRYLWRIRQRFAPHNVYTDAKNLRALQNAVGAPDPAEPREPAWRFAPEAPIALRPDGGLIQVVYSYNTVTYRYDRATNTYPRTVSGEGAQADAGTDAPVAPKNVVVMVMRFGPLRGSGSGHGRLEADYVGSGKAWISTNGRTVAGTWRKDSETGPTRFLDAAGKPVTLTVGQTFVQVMQQGARIVIEDGEMPLPSPAPSVPASPGPAGGR
jgi:hypothetical protein